MQDDLQPDIRQFQQWLAAAYAAHPPLDGVGLAEARRIVEAVRAPLARGGPAMAETTEVTLPGTPPVRLRLHRPLPQPQPERPGALIYLHGGGWVYFSVDTHDRLMRELAERTGRLVVGVDYARAPEARFPVALRQVGAVLHWLRAQAPALGVDTRRIALAGDSAGANLALATALQSRDAKDEGAAPIEALLLLYGVFWDHDDTESFRRFGGPGYTLTREEMRWFWQQYLAAPQDADNPLAMPLKAALAGLPRCCLVVADCDVLRDNSLQLARALQAAGVVCTLQRHPGTTHSFLEAIGQSSTAQAALGQACSWLQSP